MSHAGSTGTESMKEFFKQYGQEIREELNALFEDWKKNIDGKVPWGEDHIKRLQDFTLQGKMIRGALVILSYLMFSRKPLGPVKQLAAAIELVQSALLIHDDIMDRDTTRRGGHSIFHQYSLLAEKQGIGEPVHYGESLGICVGDIAFFLAFEILAKLDIDPVIRQRIQASWSRTFTTVGLAQIQDMYLSSANREVSEEVIIDLYRTKTACYTFSLPLVTGATAAGRDTAITQALEQIGELLGIAFQIKDDELDLFGTEMETGKPVGTDMEEGKKTLFHLYLLELRSSGSDILSGPEMETMNMLTRGGGIKRNAVPALCLIAEKHGIRARVREKMETFSKSAEDLIKGLSAFDKYKNVLLEVLHYNLDRKG